MPAGTDASELDHSFGTEIDHHHKLACESASAAIVHGLYAGRLLVRVKAELPHGAFRRWADAQLECGSTSVTRYMQAWRVFERAYPEQSRNFGPKCPAGSFYPESDTAALRALPPLRELAGERPKQTQPRAAIGPPKPAAPDATEPDEPAIPLRLPKDCPVKREAVKAKVSDDIRKGRAVLESMMRDLNAITKRLEQLSKDTPWLAFAHVQGLSTGLDAVRRTIRAAAPHAPCHHCKQRGCRICKPIGASAGLGWLPRDRYEMDPERLKGLV